jgi:hypothetical protein
MHLVAQEQTGILRNHFQCACVQTTKSHEIDNKTEELITANAVTPSGGRLEYLHHNVASGERRQKEKPVSREKLRHGHEFCGTWTGWQSH